MTESKRKSAKTCAVVRWIFAGVFIAALAVTGHFSGLMNEAGLLYIVLGTAAVTILGFTGPEIASSFGLALGRPGTEQDRFKAAYFWEAAARNAWILGALGSALNITVTLSSESAGISGVANRMIGSLVVVLYGLVLAVVCLIPVLKLGDRKGPEPSSAQEGLKASGGSRAERIPTARRIFGYVIFGAVLGLTVVFMIGGDPQNGPLPIVKVLLHAPAILVVVGGAIALALFTGAAGGRAWTVGFSMTGLIALLAGLIQALFGFAHRNIAEVSSAVAFIITASAFSLLGLAAVAAPLEDREVMEGRRDKPGPFSRLFWIIVPLVSFICLVLTLILVVTPMTKPGG
jgi:hypothetical protein